MTSTLLWTLFAVLLALVVLAAVVRGVKQLLAPRSAGARRQFHDH
jgi:hypothetical protein